MKIPTKDYLRKVVYAVVMTLAVAASFHLLLVTVMAIVKQSISYINPLDFLGLSILWPQYRESTEVAAIGWLVLIALFGVILYIRIHYKLYVAIIRETKVAQTINSVRTKITTHVEKYKI